MRQKIPQCHMWGNVMKSSTLQAFHKLSWCYDFEFAVLPFHDLTKKKNKELTDRYFFSKKLHKVKQKSNAFFFFGRVISQNLSSWRAPDFNMMGHIHLWKYPYSFQNKYTLKKRMIIVKSLLLWDSRIHINGAP